MLSQIPRASPSPWRLFLCNHSALPARQADCTYLHRISFHCRWKAPAVSIRVQQLSLGKAAGNRGEPTPRFILSQSLSDMVSKALLMLTTAPVSSCCYGS